MCTITFIPEAGGFLLAMNRDDVYSRAATQPPTIHNAGTRTALYPAEASGGTWIGINEAGLALAILNWNRPCGDKLRSRGHIIPALLAAGTLDDAVALLESESLEGIHPFRLLGFSLADLGVREWRWDGQLTQVLFPWEHHHWFSSGLSDEEAAAQRGSVCRQAMSEDGALSLDWLRRLHRSHGQQPGPFTICAHRETAGTLSYTELIAAGPTVTVNYSPTSLCRDQQLVSATLALKAPQDSLPAA